MRTAGEILSEKRRELGLTLEEIEKETKIRKKHLEAIEKNNFSSLPESTIVKGFIRNFAQALGLPPENVLAVFRRDFLENEKGRIIPRGMVEPLGEKGFNWTPKLTLIFGLVFLVGGFAFFLARQYLSFSFAPPLQIYLPKENQVVQEKVVVSGKTDKDASVKIEGTPITVSEDGSFKEEIILPRGENVLAIEAVNRQGKRKIVNRKVKVE